MACTLLDGGSGTELVTGSVADGELNLGSLSSHHSREPAVAATMACFNALSVHGMVAGWCKVCQSDSPLCEHKSQGSPATLSVIDFRSPMKWVRPSADAHDMVSWLLVYAVNRAACVPLPAQ